MHNIIAKRKTEKVTSYKLNKAKHKSATANIGKDVIYIKLLTIINLSINQLQSFV